MHGSTTPGSFRTWCGYNLVTGALIGLAAGALNLVALWWQGAIRVGPAASVVVSIAAGALFLFVVGVATAPLAVTRRGRIIAALGHGVGAALLAAGLCTSVMLHAFTGGYITLGAIEFGMNAERHVIAAALGPFLGMSIGVATGSLAVLIGAAWCALRRSAGFGRPELARLAVLGAPALLVVGVLPPLAIEGLSADSPELALIASFDESTQELPGLGPEPVVATRPTNPRPGPLLMESASWKQSADRAPGERPNVLLLMLESVSVNHLGYSGYTRDTSPNLDRVAQNSLRLRRAWTTATHSNYAQMALLSSLFPRRGSGLDVYQRLDYPRVLLHDIFTELGYATATVSSQDEHWQGMFRFQQTGTPTHYWHSPDFRGAHVDTGAELVIPDARTVDHALDWIAEQHGRRWALYLNLQMTHFPYRLPPDARHPFQPTGPIRGDFSYVEWAAEDRAVVTNRYDNAIAYVDEQVGRLVARLEEASQLHDTILIVTSDHGELFGEHDLVTHGRSLYDAEARVPMLVHWPKRVRPGDAYEPVSHLDVLPSVLDLMDVPAHPAFQGKSFVAARAELDQPTGVYLNIQGLKSADALVCWPWKLIADRTARRVMLHNLELDPDERDDRAGRDVGIASDMYRALRAQMVAQVAYHKARSKERTKRYAPRLLACPTLPGTRRAKSESTPQKRADQDTAESRAPSAAPL